MFRSIWIFRENIQISILTMFLYTVKYTESEFDIQNNNLLYNLHQTYHNIFKNKSNEVFYFSKQKKKKRAHLYIYNRLMSNMSNFYFVICIIPIIYISYFCILYIFLYIVYILYILYILDILYSLPSDECYTTL